MATQDDSRQHALMDRAERLLSHVWMVRTFLKHAPEAEEDPELRDIHRALYDVMLALGGAAASDDAPRYFRLLTKKLPRLKTAVDTWRDLQPEVSGHMNFRMSVTSLETAVAELERILAEFESLAEE